MALATWPAWCLTAPLPPAKLWYHTSKPRKRRQSSCRRACVSSTWPASSLYTSSLSAATCCVMLLPCHTSSCRASSACACACWPADAMRVASRVSPAAAATAAAPTSCLPDSSCSTASGGLLAEASARSTRGTACFCSHLDTAACRSKLTSRGADWLAGSAEDAALDSAAADREAAAPSSPISWSAPSCWPAASVMTGVMCSYSTCSSLQVSAS
mmetsp:Transcript_31034/g.79162  ORF Transcript_31034/g.79162 Transcript_31034/m.79162 type:complete len:214 (-) Transcript_31034:4219-4860(-)